MKKIMIVGLILFLNVVLITGCGKKTSNSDNNQTNNNQDNDIIVQENKNVIGSQKIESFKFEIISLKCEKNISTLEYSIANESSEKTSIPKYKVDITDSKDKLYIFNMNHKDKILNPNESIIIKKEIKRDLTQATSITFELVKE